METDVSIRRRALELSFALINKNNVRSIMNEILAFLDVAEAEFKSYIATNALVAADKHSPSRRWHVDTVLSVLIKVCVFGVCCRCVCVCVCVWVGGGVCVCVCG